MLDIHSRFLFPGRIYEFSSSSSRPTNSVKWWPPTLDNGHIPYPFVTLSMQNWQPFSLHSLFSTLHIGNAQHVLNLSLSTQWEWTTSANLWLALKMFWMTTCSRRRQNIAITHCAMGELIETVTGSYLELLPLSRICLAAQFMHYGHLFIEHISIGKNWKR